MMIYYLACSRTTSYFHCFLVPYLIYTAWKLSKSEYRKIRTKKTPYLDTFHAVLATFKLWSDFQLTRNFEVWRLLAL